MDYSMSLQRIFLIQHQIVKLVNISFSAGTSWSDATCESVDCADVSELFSSLLTLLLLVHHLEIHPLTLLLYIHSTDTIFSQNFI